MPELQSIRFSFAAIVTNEFAIPDEKYDPSGKSEMRLNFFFQIVEEEKVFVIQTKSLFYQLDKLLLALTVSCHFRIIPGHWEQMIDKENKTLTVSLLPALHLASLTVSTMRGILHAKTENLPINNMIMPLINLNEIIKESVVFKITNNL